MFCAEVHDFEQWLRLASRLLKQGVSPHEISWLTGTVGLFDQRPGVSDVPEEALSLSSAVQRRLEEACAFLDDERWSLPYRALWRWHKGEREALLPGDIDGTRLARRARAVCNEAHAMKGFLRFRERSAGEPRFVAWYEPRHAVLNEVALHFASRMGRTPWLIATPLGTAAWNGVRLAFGSAVSELRLDSGETEALWLSYYRSTFNPERLNERALEAHLPARFRQNLVEAPLLPALVSEARLGQSRERPGDRQVVEEVQGSCQTDHSARAGALDGLDACRRCELWEQATYPVGGSGPADAKIVIVGEQADDHDDLIGEPFSGPLGRFLETMLREAGLSREDVFLTQAVKHFRFDAQALQRRYRSPTPEHIEACKPWLEAELSRLPARVIVALGRTAARSLGLDGAELGGVSPVSRGAYEIFQTWHPAYAQRASDEAAKAVARAHIVATLCSAKQRIMLFA